MLFPLTRVARTLHLNSTRVVFGCVIRFAEKAGGESSWVFVSEVSCNVDDVEDSKYFFDVSYHAGSLAWLVRGFAQSS